MSKTIKLMAMSLLAASLTIGISSCDNGSTVQSTQTGKQDVSQPVQQSVENPISKWEFTDCSGQKYILELNKDEKTAQLKRNGKTYYGSFEKYPWGSRLPTLHFGTDASVWYKVGESWLDLAVLDESNGYLYRAESAYDAKDPNRRLKITKR